MKTLCIIFGVQIAWEIGISIVFLTAICYNLYIRFILRIAVHDMINQTVFTIAYLLLNIVKLILLSYICKSTADEVIYSVCQKLLNQRTYLILIILYLFVYIGK